MEALTRRGLVNAVVLRQGPPSGEGVMTSQSSSPNPFADNPSVSPVSPEEGTPNRPTTGREAYNIVSDTVVGMNIRKSDNLFQLKVILVCVLIGVPLGAVAGALLSDSDNRLIGAVGGGLGLGLAGAVLGLFGSGIYLMIHRAVRHVKGKHD
jgi:ABC-type microcin C transport system permease subunit YejE